MRMRGHIQRALDLQLGRGRHPKMYLNKISGPLQIIQRTLMLLLAISCLPRGSDAAKIMLEMSAMISSPSQLIVMSAFTEPLVQKGHRVTLLSPQHKVLDGLSPRAVTERLFFANSRSRDEIQNITDGIGSKRTSTSDGYIFEFFKMATDSNIRNSLTECCISLFEDNEMLGMLREENFDLIIVFPNVGCGVLLAEFLGVPFVVVSSVRRYFVITEDHFQIPIPSSYVPFSFFTPFTDRMTFTERLMNNVMRHVAHPLLEFAFTLPLRKIKRDLNIRPDLSLSQTIGEAKLWFVYQHFALDFAQPTAPNLIPIGGITATLSKPLPKDVNDFVEGSGDHGIIVFTLGSMVTSLGSEMSEMMAKVFGELPQRVLWRYKGRKLSNLGNNTLLSDWLPQNDLLGHPKTRMFIYHGGSAGVYEATSHGVPLLLVPLWLDQKSNAARVVAKGLGRSIDKDTMTESEFKEAVLDVLNSAQYKANMAHASEIMRDSLDTPQERVVFWIEHVLKFGGDHLRLRALDLNFIQRSGIDVVLFLAVVLVTLIMFIRLIVVRCFFRMSYITDVKEKNE